MNHPVLVKWSLTAALLTLLLTAPASAADNLALNAARESIVSADLMRHVEALADDTLEGREAGSRGGRAAGTYIVGHLKRLGLAGAAPRGGYFQALPTGGRNILALLPGRDDRLKEEVVVIGAHYDHVGYGRSGNSYGPVGLIHNGADDNASGTSGLIELAEALARLPEPPRRSLLLAWWDGEEKGLLGSKHWLASPTLPLRRVVIDINLDMIGRLRNNHLSILGTRTTRGMRSLLSHSNRRAQLDLDFTWELIANSDHYPFISAGIPAIMFHTGLHPDYHRPSDDADRINADGMKRVVRLLFDTTMKIANREEPTPFRRAALSEKTKHAQRLFERPVPQPPGRLGIHWTSLTADKGLIVSHVVSGSAAAQGGIRAGDRITRFAGTRVTDDNAFLGSVLTAKNPVKVEVRRTGATEPVVLTLQLAGHAIRIGMAWREDKADPHSMMLVQVIRGSSAQRAGLRVGDRVLRAAGNRLRDDEHLRKLALTLPGPIKLQIERHGRLKTVVLEISPPSPSRRNKPVNSEVGPVPTGQRP